MMRKTMDEAKETSKKNSTSEKTSSNRLCTSAFFFVLSQNFQINGLNFTVHISSIYRSKTVEKIVVYIRKIINKRREKIAGILIFRMLCASCVNSCCRSAAVAFIFAVYFILFNDLITCVCARYANNSRWNRSTYTNPFLAIMHTSPHYLQEILPVCVCKHFLFGTWFFNTWQIFGIFDMDNLRNDEIICYKVLFFYFARRDRINGSVY